MTKSRYLEPCPECGQYKYEDDDCTKCEVRQDIAFKERLAKSNPTPLPWTVGHGEVNSSIYDADGQHIATVFPHCNAKYIMDCVNSRAVPSVDMAEVERLVDELTQVAFMVSKLAIPLKDGDNHALPKSVIDKARTALAAVKTKGGGVGWRWLV